MNRKLRKIYFEILYFGLLKNIYMYIFIIYTNASGHLYTNKNKDTNYDVWIFALLESDDELSLVLLSLLSELSMLLSVKELSLFTSS